MLLLVGVYRRHQIGRLLAPLYTAQANTSSKLHYRKPKKLLKTVLLLSPPDRWAEAHFKRHEKPKQQLHNTSLIGAH